MTSQVRKFGGPALGEGNIVPERLNVRGDLIQMQSPQQWVLEGRVWQATVGTLSTPIVGGGSTTVILIDQPELIIDVPSDVVVRICHVRADAQIATQTTDNHETEILLAVDRTAQVVPTANFTAETPINFRTDIIGGSLVTVTSAITENVPNTPTLSMELAHPVKTTNFGDATFFYIADLVLDYDPKIKPFIVGPAAILLYAGGSIATDIFISAVWAEFRKTELGL